jgi:hypothetical protein
LADAYCDACVRAGKKPPRRPGFRPGPWTPQPGVGVTPVQPKPRPPHAPDKDCCETTGLSQTWGKCCNCSSSPIVIRPEDPPPDFCTLQPGQCHDCDGVLSGGWLGPGNVFKVADRCSFCLFDGRWEVECKGLGAYCWFRKAGGVVRNPGFSIPAPGVVPPNCR